MDSTFAAARLPDGKNAVKAVITDPDTTTVTERTRNLLHTTAEVVRAPHPLNDETVTAAHAAGATDDDIHDTILTTAALCMFNRHASALDTEPPADPAYYTKTAQRILTDGYEVHSTERRKALGPIAATAASFTALPAFDETGGAAGATGRGKATARGDYTFTLDKNAKRTSVRFKNRFRQMTNIDMPAPRQALLVTGADAHSRYYPQDTQAMPPDTADLMVVRDGRQTAQRQQPAVAVR
ncbi:hypothetical protein AB0A94_35245 [Streptomyces sp. NPDC044984]|uniref:hypothetical protein n=1 Tax=Streptomyces sp. NPDC044984 TaxID=3154335 RepID=UPI00340504D9